MAARDHLIGDEFILAAFPPFYATTQRIIRCETKPGGDDDWHELPYYRVASVELVRKPRHTIALGGIAIALAGVFLWSIGFITAVPTVVLGLGLIGWGARGQESYYQFRGYQMAAQDLSKWQVRFRGSAGFIIAVGEHVKRPMNW